ncbi:fibronectin type III-like domain-contianing protein, partial [Bacteroides sp. OttesenSCG-928-D19]|nr:fibronectin type III-like domain-contianing protein [Bacteroides sp. OttesenSCG-928-D19]
LYLSNKRDFPTPIKALKAFRRIHLKAGEMQKITFTLTEKELSLVNAEGKLVPMQGKVEVHIGGGGLNMQEVFAHLTE